MSARTKIKDKEMAATLKKRGVKRTTGQCPLCHHTVATGMQRLLTHFATSCKPRRKGERPVR